MPRLCGYQERLFVNFYDNAFLGQPLDVHRHRYLFSDAQVGDVLRTNMQVKGMFPGDQTMIITNWYARTSFDHRDRGAFDALAHFAHAELIIGDRPYRKLAWSELLRRSPDETMHDAATQEQRELEHEMKAKNISEGTGVALQDVKSVLVRVDRKPWLIVPVRQQFRVSCTWTEQVDQLLKQIADRDGTKPGFWIHVEGWLTRDVA